MISMDKKFEDIVMNAHEGMHQKHVEEKRDMSALRAMHEEMLSELITLKEANPTKEEALKLHADLFLRSVGVKSEDELNRGQKHGFIAHMNSTKDLDAQSLIDMNIKVIKKYIENEK